VGKLELRVPQDRDGRFSTELFERCQRSEQALVSRLAEMYVQGVSTRKVKAITEELCGHAFSASAISAVNERLDESLEAFAKRPLAEPFPYLILDARYEKVREGGVVMSQAVLIAKWGARYPKLVGWVEETIEETLIFYRLPRQHHKHLKSTNMLERLNEEIKRRTHVIRIFPMPRPACASSGP
jgi:transposase-like protein